MNSKTAKLLREAAAYSPSKTPGRLTWPGIARIYNHPVYEQRVVKRASGWLDDKTRDVREVKRMVHYKDRPIIVLDEKGDPKVAAVPVTKPARLTPGTPKAVYRALKRLEKKVGIQRIYAYLRGADDAEIARLTAGVATHLESGRPA